MKPTRFCQRVLLLACAAACMGGCEKHVVSTTPSGDYMGMHIAPTQVESPPPPPEPSSFPNPFKWIGDGFSDLAGVFKGNDEGKPLQINGQGQSVQVPPGYTGQTNFTAADGKAYRLNFQNGALVGVDPAPASASPPPAAAPRQ